MARLSQWPRDGDHYSALHDTAAPGIEKVVAESQLRPLEARRGAGEGTVSQPIKVTVGERVITVLEPELGECRSEAGIEDRDDLPMRLIEVQYGTISAGMASSATMKAPAGGDRKV
jgi:hypothetical protein